MFVGTLDYDPCEKGVWFCCTKILPCLRREVPELRFVVVGCNPSSRLRALRNRLRALCSLGVWMMFGLTRKGGQSFCRSAAEW